MSARALSEQEKLASLAERLEAGSVLLPFCGCRVWMGATRDHGYGMIGFGRKAIKAHRAAYMLAHGEIPAGEGYHGTVVRHTCDVPSCVNPDHLEIGSQADNMVDVANRGNRKGERHHLRKLSDEAVREIRKSGESQTHLAKRFGVHPSTISFAKSGRCWSHIGE